MKYLLFLLLLTGASCTTGQREATQFTDTAPLVEYADTLPCADCEGIYTSLAIDQSSSSEHRTYRLTETYLGSEEGNTTFSHFGSYRELPADSSGYSRLLLDSGMQRQRYFFRIDSNTLEMADQRGERIESELNYQLKRQP